MRDALLTLMLLAVPLVAVAQPEDRDCTGFTTRMAAQGTYLAAQELMGQTDYHRLDSDGNGVACESITTIQRDSLLDIQGAYSETVARMQTVACPDTSFALKDFIAETRGGFKGEGSHVEWTTMMQCVELHLAIRQNE